MDQAAPLIYVVEDDREMRNILEEVLTDSGYQTLGCPTAYEAWYLIEAEPPDLMLLDNHLEQYGAGWALLKKVRAESAAAKVPIIIISADVQFLRLWSSELHAQRCFVIEKPFDLDDVLATVYAAIGVAPIEHEVPGV